MRSLSRFASSLGFVLFRPFGGAAYGYGREDDDGTTGQRRLLPIAVASAVPEPRRSSVQTVLGVRAQELFDRVDVPSDDDLAWRPRRSACGYGPPS